MSAEITKVTLKLGKREIEMTVEEARNLKAALEGLFGKEIVKEVVRDGCTHWHWGVPYFGGAGTITNIPQPQTPPYEIICQSDGNLCVSMT